MDLGQKELGICKAMPAWWQCEANSQFLVMQRCCIVCGLQDGNLAGYVAHFDDVASAG